MNKQQLKITGVLATLILCISIIYLSFTYLQYYFIPSLSFVLLLVGFLPPYLSGGKFPMTKLECYKLSFSSLAITLLALLYLTKAGMLATAIVMTLPITTLIVWLFSYLAFRISDKKVFKVKDFFK